MTTIEDQRDGFHTALRRMITRPVRQCLLLSPLPSRMEFGRWDNPLAPDSVKKFFAVFTSRSIMCAVALPGFA